MAPSFIQSQSVPKPGHLWAEGPGSGSSAMLVGTFSLSVSPVPARGEALASCQVQTFPCLNRVAVLVPWRKLWFTRCGFACGKFQIKLLITVQRSLYLNLVPYSWKGSSCAFFTHHRLWLNWVLNKQLQGKNFLAMVFLHPTNFLSVGRSKDLAKVESNNVRFHHQWILVSWNRFFPFTSPLACISETELEKSFLLTDCSKSRI